MGGWRDGGGMDFKRDEVCGACVSARVRVEKGAFLKNSFNLFLDGDDTLLGVKNHMPMQQQSANARKQARGGTRVRTRGGRRQAGGGTTARNVGYVVSGGLTHLFRRILPRLLYSLSTTTTTNHSR